MRWLDSVTDSIDVNLRKLRDGEGQGNLACCSPQGRKELDRTEQLNYNNNASKTWLSLCLDFSLSRSFLAPPSLYSCFSSHVFLSRGPWTKEFSSQPHHLLTIPSYCLLGSSHSQAFSSFFLTIFPISLTELYLRSGALCVSITLVSPEPRTAAGIQQVFNQCWINEHCLLAVCRAPAEKSRIQR